MKTKVVIAGLVIIAFWTVGNSSGACPTGQWEAQKFYTDFGTFEILLPWHEDDHDYRTFPPHSWNINLGDGCMSIGVGHGVNMARKQFYEEGPTIFTYEEPPKSNLLTVADSGKEMKFVWWDTEERGGSADFDYTKGKGLWATIRFDAHDFNENDALRIAKSFKFVEGEPVTDSRLAEALSANHTEVKPT